MKPSPLERVLRQIRATAAAGRLSAAPDRHLLDLFVRQRDETAFAAMLERHGPMVLGVCRRTLADEHGADDVFQAVFLLLARKAASIRRRDSVGPRLHGTAQRLARKAVADAARGRRPDRRPPVATPTDVLEDLSGRELLRILDEELAALPERYQLPLVLCHLEGRTRDEAAVLLGWTAGQVKGRLERGRAHLRDRLVRRGVSLTVALSATLLSDSLLSAAVPAGLASVLVRSAVAYGSGAAVQGLIAPHVLALMEGAWNTMFASRLKLAIAGAFATVVVGLGAGAFTRTPPMDPSVPVSEQPSTAESENPRSEPKRAQAQPPVPPPILGQIKHRTVAEFPLPRDRLQFGIGEEVDFWVEGDPALDDLAAVVAWHVQGAGTVYPIVGVATILTLDVTDKEGQLTVIPARRDLGIGGRRRPDALEQDLRTWLRDQIAALPQRALQPVYGPPPNFEYREELRKDVYEKLDALRKGTETPFAQLDDLGRTLLAKYSAPTEAGQIYYHLAHLHAQADLAHPERVIEYARKALAYPLEAWQVSRLFTYWGDAVQVARANEAVTERRKWAALPYLAGLWTVLQHPLPEKAPELPGVGAYDIDDPTSDAGRLIIKRHEEQMIARRLAEFQRTMVQHRDVLTGQLVALYGRGPAADNELRDLAAELLRDQQAVERLLAAVQKARENKR
jgi:RNA polymerase sigma factor (sigma-70 family)